MKQVQKQQLQQKFSPQQIQLMRLLQLPVTDLEQAIKEEVEKNPLLEAEMPVTELPQENAGSDWDANDDDEDSYDYHEHLESDPNAVRREFVVVDSQSAIERLMDQLALLPLTDRQRTIATEIIGTLDDAGYLSRDLALVANDMAFRQGIETTPEEVEQVLHVVQSLDPAGIGARNLRECLLLQLQRRENENSVVDDSVVNTALAIVRDHFDDFAAHRYERICEAMGIDEEELDEAADIIRHLDPKPGSSGAESDSAAAYVIPDIVLTQHDGQLQFYLNDSGLPQLSLNSYYTSMLSDMEQSGGDKEAMRFLRSKQADAQEFIDLLQQRHDTIVRVMRYIIKHQRRFLLTGDSDQLQPMRQREVAEATGLDISTVSRMANSKYIQTDFGTIPLKDCFSKGMATDDGEEVSIETIKQHLADIIAAEDKRNPLSDDALAKLFNERGLPIARRTVAKYRELLGIPVARLRRLVVLIVLLFSTLHSPLSAQMSYYDSVINARLEAAKKTATPPASREKGVNKPSSHASKKETVPSTPLSAPTQPASANLPTLRSPLSANMVPMWYDAFPDNRVNPFGRTAMAVLPDEINLLLVRDTADFCFPVCSRKTSNYGWRWNRGHHGVDIGLKTGEPVHAAFSGTVRVARRMGGYGNCVVIRHANGLETLYGHLSKINVEPMQEVAAGEIIGLGGSTGNSTGPHLHFECRFLYQTFDPEWILDFETYGLRTRRLHLDKSYFGITKPRGGETLDYKADQSVIREPRRRPKQQVAAINPKDF